MVLVATGDNIRKIRQQRGYSQQKLADLAHVGRSAIAQYERLRNEPPIEVLRKLADGLGVKTVDLLDLKVEDGMVKEPVTEYRNRSNLGPEVPVARVGFRFVPIYGAITAGLPASNYSDVLEWHEMPEWGGDFERWGRVIEGDSMTPEFEEDDVAIFENRQWRSGDGVHAFKDGEDVFKIAWKEGDRVLLRPTNREHPDIDAEGWQIKGVCIRRLRKFDKGVRDTREYVNGFKWRDF